MLHSKKGHFYASGSGGRCLLLRVRGSFGGSFGVPSLAKEELETIARIEARQDNEISAIYLSFLASYHLRM